MKQVWKPSVVVAAVIENEGRFLLVEEKTEEGIRFNQPTGHLEVGESLQEAVVREVFEETGYDFYPEALVGNYLLRWEKNGRVASTFLRFAFTGKIGHLHNKPLDSDIIRTVWLTKDEIIASKDKHRSVLLMKTLEDYLEGKKIPLSFLSTLVVTDE